ncbi:MAG: hypothetical protein RIQ81_692 [Pseudomonadota bacterium]|jgi:hypothetical protein
MKVIQPRKAFAALAFCMSVATGCTHSVHMVHVSDFAPHEPFEGGKVVKATGEQFAIMGFVSDTNYVNKAYASLQAKCPNEEIQGITTQYSTSHGFFSWTNKILMQGLCLAD